MSIPNSTTVAASGSRVGPRCAVQTARCDRFPCCRERVSEEHPHSSLRCFMDVLRSTEVPFVLWAKRATDFRNRINIAPCFALLRPSCHSR